MKEDVFNMFFGVETTYEVWTSLKEQLLLAIVEKEMNLKNMLMTLKKGSQSLEEYLRDLKNICDNLIPIKKPISDQDKVFQFAHGLGQKYKNFQLAMLTKPPYHSFMQFMLAL